MADPGLLYARGVRKILQYYYAAWLPNEDLRLGDVGVLEKGVLFRRTTSLGRFGINFAIRNDPHPTPFTLQSDKGVQITSKVAGQTCKKAPNIPDIDAGVAVDFSSKGAFVVKADFTYESTIEDIATLGKQIKDLFKNQVWDKNWVIIAKLVTAPSATILVSRSSQGKIELTAQGKFAIGSIVQLGQANLKFNASFVSGNILDLRDAQNITPFFQLAGLKQRWSQAGTAKPYKAGAYLGAPMHTITPAMVREDKKVASSLYVDFIREPIAKAKEK